MRNISGVLFLDKVSGISSYSLLQRAKIIFQAKKAGHTGTLDPLATGMLPVCFGEATKFAQYLLKSDKSYKVVAKLGERTNTFDSFGSIICIRPIEQFNKLYLNRILNTFIGERYQSPPFFSAVKYCGYPLYHYARHGTYISKAPRLINIYKINLIQWDGKYIELDLSCSTGTYIRTFIDDLGECLGCGAHVVSLRRLSVASFSSELMISIKVLEDFFKTSNDHLEYLSRIDRLLYPIDILVCHFPEVNVSSKIYRLLQFGQRVQVDSAMFFSIYTSSRGIVSDNKQIYDQLVRITVGDEKKFFGVGSIIDSKYLLARRLVVRV